MLFYFLFIFKIFAELEMMCLLSGYVDRYISRN